MLGLLLALPAGELVAQGSGDPGAAAPPPWAGPVCDRAWPYQGELPRRSVPDEVWSALSGDSLGGTLEGTLQAVLEAALDTILARSKAPAISAAVGIPGEGLWSTARGVARTKPRVELTEPALFHAGSIGKVFTSVLIHQLVEARQLDLDNSVYSWFLDYPNAGFITVDHLLTHTSGVYSYTDHPQYQRRRSYRPAEALIEFAAKQPPRFCPGAQWSYSNTGYVMLGRIAERTRVGTLQSLLIRHIIEPLGLLETVPRFESDAPQGHVTGHREGKPVRNMSYALPHGAGIVSTTAGDLVRFWHALLTGELLSDESVRGMFRDMFPMWEKEETYYGRGVMMYDVPGGPGLMLGHGGGVVGFRGIVGYLVEDGIYVAVLASDEVPVEAGLFTIVQAVRENREGSHD